MSEAPLTSSWTLRVRSSQIINKLRNGSRESHRDFAPEPDLRARRRWSRLRLARILCVHGVVRGASDLCMCCPSTGYGSRRLAQCCGSDCPPSGGSGEPPERPRVLLGSHAKIPVQNHRFRILKKKTFLYYAHCGSDSQIYRNPCYFLKYV